MSSVLRSFRSLFYSSYIAVAYRCVHHLYSRSIATLKSRYNRLRYNVTGKKNCFANAVDAAHTWNGNGFGNRGLYHWSTSGRRRLLCYDIPNRADRRQ